jgi:hypothetical protein
MTPKGTWHAPEPVTLAISLIQCHLAHASPTQFVTLC